MSVVGCTDVGALVRHVSDVLKMNGYYSDVLKCLVLYQEYHITQT